MINRWSLLWQEFDAEICYRPGPLQAHVDAMSRAPIAAPALVAFVSDNELAREQRRDPWIAPMIEYLQHGRLPEDPEQARVVVAEAAMTSLGDGGVLVLPAGGKNSPKGARALVPLSLREQLVQRKHDHKWRIASSTRLGAARRAGRWAPWRLRDRIR
jgi:hypothetical protein